LANTRGHGRDHGIKASNWWGSTAPTTGPVGTSGTWVGNVVGFVVPGRVCGFRWYKNDVQAYSKLFVWGATDILTMELATCFDSGGDNAGNGWNQTWFRPWFPVDTVTTYRFGTLFQAGHYWRTNTALVSFPVAHGNIKFYAGWQSTALDPIVANPTGNTNANGVDILFYPD